MIRVAQLSIEVPAGAAVPLYIAGEFLSLRMSNTALRFRGDGVDAVLTQGQSIRLGAVQRIEVENDTAVNALANIVYGTGEFLDATVTGTVNIASGLNLATPADIAVGAGATVELAAASSARRELVVQNLNANTETLRIGDAAAAASVGLECTPGQAVTVTGGAAVYAYNPGAGAQSVAVLAVMD